MTVDPGEWTRQQAHRGLCQWLETLALALSHGRLPTTGPSSAVGEPLETASAFRLRSTAVLLRTALTVLQGLQAGRLTPKRDVYYRDIRLYGHRQATSDRAIERIGRLLGVPREALFIVGGSRGLLYGGPVSLWLRSPDAGAAPVAGGVVEYRADGTRHLVPHTPDIVSVETGIDFVLIVEKEAVFSMLVEEYGPVRRAVGNRDFLLVTARGYPDRATALFLGMLRQQRPGLSFFALVDWDPFGWDIARVYREGLGNRYGEESGLPDLQVIGLCHEDLSRSREHNDSIPSSATVFLADSDKRRLLSLLKRHTWPECHRQLLLMNDTGTKAELDVVADTPGPRQGTLCATRDYVVDKLLQFLPE